jgi:putative ABC transport system permease protein
MSVKISGENRKETLQYISAKWDEFVTDQPIISAFLEDEMSDLYDQDRSTGQIFTIFSVLAIFIAALGLLGLASFSADQRTKEVGIRKVFGSSISGVVGILSREVVWLIVIATLIAWPLGYFFMKDWLQDFASRVDLTVWVFLLSTVLAFLIAFITVSLRAYQAAVVNPARSLRYE